MKRAVMRGFVVAAWVLLGVPAVGQAQSTEVDAIKASIPQKWWEEGSWDQREALEKFLSGYTAKDRAGAEARFWLGCNHRILGEYDLALEAFNRVLTDYPDQRVQVAKAHFEIGQVYYWFKTDYDAALAQYQLVAEQYPDMWEGVEALKYIGECYVAKQDDQKALAAFEQAYGKGKIRGGMGKAEILVRQASLLPATSPQEIAARNAAFTSAASFYKTVHQACPMEEEGGAALQGIIDGIANLFAKWDGNTIRSMQFVQFQRYGSAGSDGAAHTADDLTDPLAGL